MMRFFYTLISLFRVRFGWNKNDWVLIWVCNQSKGKTAGFGEVGPLKSDPLFSELNTLVNILAFELQLYRMSNVRLYF
jgi:hypothetical protein